MIWPDSLANAQPPGKCSSREENALGEDDRSATVLAPCSASNPRCHDRQNQVTW